MCTGSSVTYRCAFPNNHPGLSLDIKTLSLWPFRFSIIVNNLPSLKSICPV